MMIRKLRLTSVAKTGTDFQSSSVFDCRNSTHHQPTLKVGFFWTKKRLKSEAFFITKN